MRILSTEDDPVIRTMLSELIVPEGHEIEFARNSDDFFKLIGIKTYDLLILDVNIAGLNGYQIAREVCQRLGDKRPKMLLFTGRDTQQEKGLVAISGVDGVLEKGCSPYTVLEAINRLAEPVPAAAAPQPARVVPPARPAPAAPASKPATEDTARIEPLPSPKPAPDTPAAQPAPAVSEPKPAAEDTARIEPLPAAKPAPALAQAQPEAVVPPAQPAPAAQPAAAEPAAQPAAVAPVGTMAGPAKSPHQIELDRLTTRVSSVVGENASLSQRLEGLNRRLAALEDALKDVGARTADINRWTARDYLFLFGVLLAAAALILR